MAPSALCCGPRGETSDHKGKCKFITDIFKQPVLGLSEALRCVVLLAAATCVVGCDEFCVNLMHCKAMKGNRARLSIHPKMLLASYCPGAGLSHLGRGFDTLLLLALGSCHSITINCEASESSVAYNLGTNDEKKNLYIEQNESLLFAL